MCLRGSLPSISLFDHLTCILCFSLERTFVWLSQCVSYDYRPNKAWLFLIQIVLQIGKQYINCKPWNVSTCTSCILCFSLQRTLMWLLLCVVFVSYCYRPHSICHRLDTDCIIRVCAMNIMIWKTRYSKNHTKGLAHQSTFQAKAQDAGRLAWPHFCRTELHSPPNGDFCPRIWAS